MRNVNPTSNLLSKTGFKIAYFIVCLAAFNFTFAAPLVQAHEAKKRINELQINLLLANLENPPRNPVGEYPDYLKNVQKPLINHYPSFKGQNEEVAVEEIPSSETISYSTVTEKTYTPVDIENPVIPSISSNELRLNPEEGIIGVSEEFPYDSPVDNVFLVNLDDLPKEGETIWLNYEVYGVDGVSGVSSSLNSNSATGGYLVKTTKDWATIKEPIRLSTVKKGDNYIRFTIPKNATYNYKIKNVTITTNVSDQLEDIVFGEPEIKFEKGGQTYVKGIINNPSYKSLYINNRQIHIDKNNSFESLVDLTQRDKERGHIEVKIIKDDNSLVTKKLSLAKDLQEADFLVEIIPALPSIEKEFGALEASLTAYGASLFLPSGALENNTKLSISELRPIDISPMESGMVNVTINKKGYRFLPHGTMFSKEGKVAIPYDEKLIPSGHSVEDIRTYYFDDATAHWLELELDSIDQKNKLIISKTNHFTDMINGVIQVPESPQTNAFAPTMMSDIKAADPTAGLNLMQPPSASQDGAAHINYPIVIPPGRNGMQPNLAIQYNSEGGNGWMGLGWNIDVPAITLDTRWGVPEFASHESEIYLLGGEQLVYPKTNPGDGENNPGDDAPYLPHRHRTFEANGETFYTTAPQPRNSSGSKTFYLRKEGSFTKIERFGTSPSTYYWKVTSTDGTIYWYGADESGSIIDQNSNEYIATVLKDDSGNIVHWALVKVIDVFGNNILYTHNKQPETTMGGRQLYLKQIKYTGRNATPGLYSVTFNRETSVNRPDISINGKLKFKQVDARRLESIEVRYNNANPPIRKYKFNYTIGIFNKSLLKEIVEYNEENVEVQKHSLIYHDDISKDGNTLYSAPQTVSVGSINPDFLFDLDNKPGMAPSKLGSQQITNVGWELAPFLGGISLFYVGGSPNWCLTLGTTLSENKKKDRGMVSMTDIDGNGLEDVVYRTNSGLKYIPRSVTRTHNFNGNITYNYSLDPAKNIMRTDGNAMHNFLYSEGITKTRLFETFDLNAVFQAYYGYRKYENYLDTDIYFADGNGDGLPDIVDNGTVYFNRQINGETKFNSSSADTPNMLIVANTGLDEEDYDPPLQETGEKNYDVVRMWQAPFRGTIEIKDNIQIQGSSSDIRMIYSIETAHLDNPTNLYRLQLLDIADHLPHSYTLNTNLGASIPLGNPTLQGQSIQVEAGQKIFFRIHNLGESNEAVNWNPEINYLTRETSTNDEYPLIDENNYSTIESNYSNSFLLTNDNEVSLPGSGKVYVNWSDVNIQSPSDSVHYEIIIRVHYPNGSAGEQTTLIKTIPMGENHILSDNGGIVFNIDYGKYFANGGRAGILFRVRSDSNPKWKDLEWKPIAVYDPDANAIAHGVPDVNVTINAVADYTAYEMNNEKGVNIKSYGNLVIKPRAGWVTPSSSAQYGILPNTTISLPSINSGKFLMVVKNNNLVIGKRLVRITDGVVSLPENDPIVVYSGNLSTETIYETISVEFYADNQVNATVLKNYISTYTNQVVRIGYDWTQPASSNKYYKSSAINVFYNKSPYGALIHNWGQFFYNETFDDPEANSPSDTYGKLINYEWVQNPFAHIDFEQLLIDLGVDIDEDYTDEELEQLIMEQLQPPGEGATQEDWDDYNEAMQLLLEELTKPSPILIAKPIRNEQGDKKWIGFFSSQFIKSNSSYLGDLGDVWGGAFDDPNPVVTPMQVDLKTGMYGIPKKSKSISHSNTYGAGNLNYSISKSGIGGNGYNRSITDFMDLNGDRYPDMIYPSQTQITTMTGGHKLAANSSWGHITENESKSEGVTNSASTLDAGILNSSEAKLISGDTNSLSSSQDQKSNVSVSARIGIDVDLGGYNQTNKYWADLNGDGLPDMIVKEGSSYKFKINKGQTTSFGTSENFSSLTATKSTPGPIAVSGGISADLSGLFDGIEMPDDFGFSFSVSIGAGASTSDTDANLIDVNGDGLVDLVKLEGETTYKVYFNKGNGFHTQGFDLKYSGGDLNMKTQTDDISFNAGANASFFYGWPVVFIFFVPVLYVKLGNTGSINGSITKSDTQKSIQDFDGDGYPDFIEKNGESVRVYYSKIRRSNKLESVTNPLGAKFELDYTVEGNTKDMPSGKWVLSKVTVTPKNPFFAEKKNTKYFKYENGYYDRREREFFGFETVKTLDLNASANPTNYNQVETNAYRTQINRYHNKNYFLKGLLKESYTIKGYHVGPNYSNIPTSKIFTRTVNEYDLHPLTNDHKRDFSVAPLGDSFDTGGKEGRNTAVVTLKQTDNYVYELTSSPIWSQQIFHYDEYARISKLEYKGDTSTNYDDYESEVTYHNDAGLVSKNILSVPSEIKVKLAGNPDYLRRRTTENINLNTGAIGKIKAFYKDENDTEVFAETDMTYNADGKVATITYPKNANNQRVQLTYEYNDGFIQNNVTKVKDNFTSTGYSSTSTYEPKYGNLITSTDTNGNAVKYKYDTTGRLIQVNSPKEPNDESQYTIQLSYHPLKINDVSNTTAYPYAITKHFDTQNPLNPIETYTFTDGIGRVVQVKKDIDMQALGTNASNEKMAISGKVVTDIYGRAIAQYHPYYENKNGSINNALFLGTSQFVNPTVTEYDEIDRVKITTLPVAGHTTEMFYTVEPDFFGDRQMETKSVTKQIGSVDITTYTYTDVNGRTTSVKNVLTGTGGGDIWTKYVYDNIGQLSQVIDHNGNTIESRYDLLGRRIEMTHPDAGTNRYWYDPAGNLTKMQTPNLLNYPVPANDQFIKYSYDALNRLTNITYPPIPAAGNLNNVLYAYGSPSTSVPNGKGKLIAQRDATGKQEFEYGNMGELTKATRWIVAPNLPDRTFVHQYEYDSWNRLQKLTYPDNEEVNYAYDLGGNLLKMTGQNGSNPYDYIKQITYDHFEQRTAIKYGNNTVNTYTYSPELRRLTNMNAKQANSTVMLNTNYTYDYTGNVKTLQNTAAPVANKMGGHYLFSYSYDNLNRLTGSSGVFSGYDGSSPPSFEDLSASYTLAMQYDKLHNITKKTQSHTRDGASFGNNTYTHNYHYVNGKPHQLLDIQKGTSANYENFVYDANGNMKEHSGNSNWLYFWDESNRLRSAVQQELKMRHYIYDAGGERTLKASSSYTQVYENGQPTNGGVTMNGYTTYPSPYITINSSAVYTKHYFAGSQRVASRPIGSANIFNIGFSTEFDELKAKQTGDAQAVADSLELGQIEMGEEDIDPTPLPPAVYYFHPDHLGSSTVITDGMGYAYQIFLNLPFGETMAEQRRSGTFNNIFKFNGKELDTETGLYYYGARYYNPRISNWLSVDPIALWQPVQENEHYILGQHNGGYFNPKNMSVYGYTYQNPIRYVDPNGKQSDTVDKILGGFEKMVNALWSTHDFSGDKPRERSNYERQQEFASGTVQVSRALATKEAGHIFLDIAGVVDPTPISDTANAIWYVFEGDYTNAAISGIAVFPYIGDSGKAVKYGGKAITQIQKHHIIPQQVYNLMPEIADYILKNSGGNLKKLPNRFHGNHPAYTNWIKQEIEKLHRSGNLTEDGLKGLIENANKEINQAYGEFERTGQSLNDYFKSR